MAVTLKEVAELAGVSRSAVSRTFTAGASVSDKTRKLVESAADQLGYTPSFIARSLATNRTQLIGLVFNNFSNPYFMQVFDLFTKSLQDRGLRPLLVNLSGEKDPAHSIRMLRQYNVDAVVLASSTLPPAFSVAFKEAGLPIVHAFGRYSPTSDVHVVGIDNVHAGRIAAETLIDRGYQKIAFLGGPKIATSTQDRLAGFEEVMQQNGKQLSAVHYASNYSYEAGGKGMKKLLATTTVDAVFCGDDVLCMGAKDAAIEAGFSVPEQIGLIGFNGMELAGWRAYDLTTIRQPIEEIVQSSVELVVSILSNPSRSPEMRMFSCELIERDSLRPAASG